jgi:ribosome maturation factor RimP
MHKSDLVSKLTSAIEPLAAVHGFDLVAIEQAGGRGMPVIRVLLDREEGIDLDAIASASSWVSEAIDEAEPFSHPYTLEVSSPGVDRPLTKRDDYVRFAGQEATIRTEGDDSRKTWTGTIRGVDDEAVRLDVDGTEVAIKFDTIQKARLKGVVDFGKGKGRSQ